MLRFSRVFYLAFLKTGKALFFLALEKNQKPVLIRAMLFWIMNLHFIKELSLSVNISMMVVNDLLSYSCCFFC